MHIPDGILPAQVCVAGYAVTGLATWYSLGRINRRPDPSADIPRASLLTAAFFVASSIYIPLPPASVHLTLNGLLGVVLGYFAFPAIVIGLFFQALVLGHGGLTSLGVNAAMMGLPALLAYHLFQARRSLGRPLGEPARTGLFAFLGGALGVGLAVLIFLSLIILNIPAEVEANAERAALLALSLSHLPLIGVEGLFTALLVLFLRRVKPELLEG